MALPDLRTERLALRPVTDQDLHLLVDLDAGARFEVGEVAPGPGCWVGLHGGEAVGLWSLLPPSRPDQGPVERQAALGYWLAERHRHQGYACEGSRAVLGHAFETLDLTRVFAESASDNADGRQVLETIGMAYVRGFHTHFDGPSTDSDVEYALTHAAWHLRQ